MKSEPILHHERTTFVLHETDSSYSTVSTLRKKLITTQEPSQFDSMQYFVPAGRQNDMTFDLMLELQGCSSDMTKVEFQEFTEFILRKAKRIFFILVYLRLTSKMRDFFNYRFHDDKLPIEYNIITGEITTMGNLDVFSLWESNEICEFYDNQWRFNVPIFYYRQDEDLVQMLYDLVLPLRTILPFSIEGNSKGTPFSKVWKIIVHPDHRGNLKIPPDGIMALKECANDIEGVIEQIRVSETLNELKKKESTGNIDGVREQIGVSESQTVKELKILRAISRTLPLYESRLTLLEIAFQRGNVCYMMFPWADGGNLYEFWYRKDPPTESRLVLSWIRREIAGLLGALVLLHNLNCCHGDLKPDNILVFAESADSGDKFGWRLEIADFGIARIHELATNSRDQDTKPVSGAPRYEPPEANKNYCNSFGPWSRRYDVWSMGCIFLEFIVWISQGKDQLEKFNRKLGDRQVEKFWKFDSKKNCLVIHDVVVNQIKLTKRDIEDKIKEMNQMKRETPEEYNSDQERLHRYLLYVLRLVETRMLVIETTNNENDTKNCRATTELLFMDFFFYEMIDAMITWKHAALKFQKYHKDGGKNIIN